MTTYLRNRASRALDAFVMANPIYQFLIVLAAVLALAGAVYLAGQTTPGAFVWHSIAQVFDAIRATVARRVL